MPGMRATSSSVMLMIALGLARKPLRRRSPAELICERRRLCLRLRPRTTMMMVQDVSPTVPAMIPASKLRLIAMTRLSRYVSLQLVNCYLTVVKSGRVPYSTEAPRPKRSNARSSPGSMATKTHMMQVHAQAKAVSKILEMSRFGLFDIADIQGR